MVVPKKGNSDSIQLSPAGQAILNAWDPAKDEVEGNQCKGYGAGAISRLPTRAHVTWQDDNTLKWETDQGMQTRLFKFGGPSQNAENTDASARRRSWWTRRTRRSRWARRPPACDGWRCRACSSRRSSGSCGRARKQSKRMAEGRDEQLKARISAQERTSL